MSQPSWVKPLGKLIFVMRKERTWTQQQLATLAGVSPKTISNLERGQKDGNGYQPFGRTARQVLAAFGEDILPRLKEDKRLAWIVPVVADELRDRELQRIARRLVENGTLQKYLEEDE